jgi:CheY-like chemotaxis protein
VTPGSVASVAEDRPRSTILLVDDRPENLLALEAILASLDQELLTASSGEEALKQLLSADVAVILLDVQMPGMDGFETAQRIKQRDRTREIPIIFLTAIDRESRHAFRGYAAGAVDYITKPFDPWLLRAKVNIFMELHEKTRRLAELAADGGRRAKELDEAATQLAELAERMPRAPAGGERAALAAAAAEVGGLATRLRGRT